MRGIEVDLVYRARSCDGSARSRRLAVEKVLIPAEDSAMTCHLSKEWIGPFHVRAYAWLGG